VATAPNPSSLTPYLLKLRLILEKNQPIKELTRSESKENRPLQFKKPVVTAQVEEQLEDLNVAMTPRPTIDGLVRHGSVREKLSSIEKKRLHRLSQEMDKKSNSLKNYEAPARERKPPARTESLVKVAINSMERQTQFDNLEPELLVQPFPAIPTQNL